MTVIYSWNHVPDKQISIGTEYAFVETMRYPTSTNPYRAEVLHVASEGDKIRMELRVTKPDVNKKFAQGEEITRYWSKEDSNSGTTLIYTNYEVRNNLAFSTTIQFIEPEVQS